MICHICKSRGRCYGQKHAEEGELENSIRVEMKNKIYDNRFTTGLVDGLLSHTDLPRMKQGHLGYQFWSLYIPCTTKTDFNEPDNTVRDTVEQLDIAHRLFAMYDEFEYCDNAACARRARKAGKIASMLGAEGMHQVGNSLGVVRKSVFFLFYHVRHSFEADSMTSVYATSPSRTTVRMSLQWIGIPSRKVLKILV